MACALLPLVTLEKSKDSRVFKFDKGVCFIMSYNSQTETGSALVAQDVQILDQSGDVIRSGRRVDTKKLTALAMLTALTYLAMLLSNLLPKVAGFLQMEIKGTVVAIGGFLFGPLSAALISVAVAVIEMFTVGETGPIGCIMNCLAACSFACPAALIYKKRHTLKGAVLGLSVSIVTLTAVMLLWNYLITPIYKHMDRAVVAAMLPTVFLPFNVFKGGLNMALTLLLYKPVVTALRKARLVPESQSTESTGSKMGFLLFSLALLVTFTVLTLVLAGKI